MSSFDPTAALNEIKRIHRDALQEEVRHQAHLDRLDPELDTFEMPLAEAIVEGDSAKEAALTDDVKKLKAQEIVLKRKLRNVPADSKRKIAEEVEALYPQGIEEFDLLFEKYEAALEKAHEAKEEYMNEVAGVFEIEREMNKVAGSIRQLQSYHPDKDSGRFDVPLLAAIRHEEFSIAGQEIGRFSGPGGDWLRLVDFNKTGHRRRPTWPR